MKLDYSGSLDSKLILRKIVTEESDFYLKRYIPLGYMELKRVYGGKSVSVALNMPQSLG